MVLRHWDNLPSDMKNESVRTYYDRLNKKRTQLLLKRVFDVLIALLILIILFPILLAIGVLIKVDSKGPIMFRQTRVTRYGKHFRIFKFRTMVEDADKTGLQVTTKNDLRITRIGRILRKYRLDEIPQIFNILVGDMTFVGTRPEVVKYVEQYSEEMMATLLLPAGVTSEASIQFKNEDQYLADAQNADLTYVSVVLPQKMILNLKAIEKFSLYGDIKTLLSTVGAVFHKDKAEKKEYKLVALLTNNDDDVYCFRKELIERFIREGYHILISCPYGEKLELMKDISYLYDNASIDRRGTSIRKDFKLFRHYRKLLKSYKPDVVLLYTAKPNIYGSIAAKQLKIPYINNVTGLGSVIKMNSILQNFILFLFRFAFKKSQCIFFQNSENLLLAKKRRLINGHYQLIPGSGVDTERFPLQTYPDDSKGLVFNYIGRVMKDKGIEDYIEAAKRIKKVHANIEFNILGFIEPTEKHYENDLEELQNQGIVIYRGNQIDVRPYIIRAHAIIHPSIYGEGMSNVLLENASSGRPVITTDIAGCREIVTENITGFLYPAGDVDQLISNIEAFIRMDNEARKNMGIAGREKVRDEFNREKVVSAYLKEVMQIC
jgi:lipopolysaccharide/colanic/teichoic acid biosynthesis glycosyltransferase/glycosyltransferase involved in cell wall biosynthesis